MGRWCTAEVDVRLLVSLNPQMHVTTTAGTCQCKRDLGMKAKDNFLRLYELLYNISNHGLIKLSLSHQERAENIEKFVFMFFSLKSI